MPETFSPESLEIEGADGGPLRIDLYRARDPAPARGRDSGRDPAFDLASSHPPVVLAHGFRGYKDWGFFPLLARTLADAGFDAVAFNMSGSGIVEPGGAVVETERFRRNTYGRELDDLKRTVEWTLARAGRAGDASRAGLVGHSRGGALAILYAASAERIACVATLAAPSQVGVWEPERIAAWERGEDVTVYDFRTRSPLPVGPDLWTDYRRHRAAYDLQPALASLRAPLLVVHGDRDRVVPADHARTIASRAPSGTTELRIIHGAGHSFQAGDTIRRTPPQLLDMVESVSAWMRRWLLLRGS